jgi:hypothetical protein
MLARLAVIAVVALQGVEAAHFTTTFLEIAKKKQPANGGACRRSNKGDNVFSPRSLADVRNL